MTSPLLITLESRSVLSRPRIIPAPDQPWPQEELVRAIGGGFRSNWRDNQDEAMQELLTLITEYEYAGIH